MRIFCLRKWHYIRIFVHQVCFIARVPRSHRFIAGARVNDRPVCLQVLPQDRTVS